MRKVKTSASRSSSESNSARPSVSCRSSVAARTCWFSRNLHRSFLGFRRGYLLFVIPDVFLSLVAILQWPRTWKHVLSAVAGALLGGALLFHLAAAHQQNAHAAVARIPFIREHMFVKVDDGFRSQGLYALFWGSIEGIPYKLYAVEAPRFTRENRFLLATPPARAVRFLLVWSVFGLIAGWLRTHLALRMAHLLWIHSLVWIVVYAFYWGRILSI